MTSGDFTLGLNDSEAKTLSHIHFTPFFAGLGVDHDSSDQDIIEALLYFTRTAIQRIPGELNKFVDIARKYAPKQPWEKQEEPEVPVEKVRDLKLELNDRIGESIEGITAALRSNGIEDLDDPGSIAHICFEMVFDREGFDGTLKKKFMDSLFIASLYNIRPFSVLSVLNESSVSKEDFSEDEAEALSEMRGENQAFENYKWTLYSKPAERTEATVVVQRYGNASSDPSKGASKSSITLTEKDFTLDFHVARMAKYMSPTGKFDFETAVLGYAFHVLSWTDGTFNLPYLSRRLFSLTYPPPPPRVSAEIRRVRAGYQYQPVVESFKDYRETYSYSAWSLDTILSDFYRACIIFQ